MPTSDLRLRLESDVKTTSDSDSDWNRSSTPIGVLGIGVEMSEVITETVSFAACWTVHFPVPFIPVLSKILSTKSPSPSSSLTLIGLIGSPGHERRAVTGTLFAPRHAHPKVEEALFRDLVDSVLGVLVPLVSAVDDGVARFHEGGERGDGLVNRITGFDEDDDRSGASDGEDKVFGVVLAGQGEALEGEERSRNV
ncbi:hypothetical protein I3843_12G000900 [Carya illinoinensis]|nr:hypothetical protein I3843_12G000900 [Carya illinoinensis]